MSESNAYAILYYEDNEMSSSKFQEIEKNCNENIDDDFHNWIEYKSQSDSLITLSLFGGNIIPKFILSNIKAIKPDAFLITFSSDVGSRSQHGYINNKKESYKKVERWLMGKSEQMAFYFAMNKGDRKTVEEYLNKGFRLESLPNGNKTLWRCCFQSQGPLLLTLIGHGADVHEICPQKEGRYYNYEWSPLIMAAHYGKTDIVKALIEKGADAQYVTKKRSTTALHEAAGEDAKNRKICKLLIEAGADVNAVDARGKTPVMYNGWDKGSLTTIKLFEKNGADLGYYSPLSGNLTWQATLKSHSYYGREGREEKRKEYAKELGIEDYLTSKGFSAKAPTDTKT